MVKFGEAMQRKEIQGQVLNGTVLSGRVWWSDVR